jgi:hypothetical protein
MSEIKGKTYSVLNRLHHFCAPDMLGSDMLNFADIFGRRLERAEKDLYDVMHSHHVQTADNEGSLGYTAKHEERGDLDKLFAMYLEYLGGTSQLMRMNPEFTIYSFDERRLVNTLIEEKAPFIEYMRNYLTKLPHSPHSPTPDSPSPDLKRAESALILKQLLKKDETVFDFLSRYHISNALLKPADISRQFAAELILYKKESHISKYIQKKLKKDTRELIYAYAGKQVSDTLKRALSDDINNLILKDSYFFIKNYENSFKKIIERQDKLQLKKLCQSVFHNFFKEKYLKEENPEKRELLIKELDEIEKAPKPPGDDLIRVNRRLLDELYSYHFADWKKTEIPILENVRKVLKESFNYLLTSKALTYTPEKFPEMDKEDFDIIKKSFEKKITKKKIRKKWTNRKLLESAFPLEIEKYYIPYRDRLLQLIQVLKNGAATCLGIQDIIAANLGITGNDTIARKAKALIGFEEFLPESISYFNDKISLFQDFESRPVSISNIKLKLSVLEIPHYTKGLKNIKLTDRKTGKYLFFPGIIKTGDILTIDIKDRKISVYLNGIYLPQFIDRIDQTGILKDTKTNISQWHFEAQIPDIQADKAYPVSRFCEADTENNDKNTDNTYFDKSALGFSEPVIKLNILSEDLTPGAFKLRIPWHIEGFTDKYSESPDHPRHQILSIINKVKAAGVMPLLSYYQFFKEEHNIEVNLGITARGEKLNQLHEIEDKFSTSMRGANSEAHNVKENLILSGAFDYTKFESLNKFN